jgi:uncharacterized protein
MRTPNEQLDGHDADLSAADNMIESLRQQLAEANHAHEFMSQQYLDALKERNQLRKDVAKLQEALHCKLTWKPS